MSELDHRGWPSAGVASLYRPIAVSVECLGYDTTCRFYGVRREIVIERRVITVGVVEGLPPLLCSECLSELYRVTNLEDA